MEIAAIAGKLPIAHFCLLVLESAPLDSKCVCARSLTTHPACALCMPIGTAPRNSARRKCMGIACREREIALRTGCPSPSTARLLL